MICVVILSADYDKQFVLCFHSNMPSRGLHHKLWLRLVGVAYYQLSNERVSYNLLSRLHKMEINSVVGVCTSLCAYAAFISPSIHPSISRSPDIWIVFYKLCCEKNKQKNERSNINRSRFLSTKNYIRTSFWFTVR
jgi:hypothetical protein